MKMTKTDSELYDAAFRSIEGLARVVRRLTQEVEVLKSMHNDKGIWDEQHYRKALVKRFIDDHNSAGRLPMTTYSYYPYILDEPSFLKHCFHSSDAEIAAFNREVNYVSALT